MSLSSWLRIPRVRRGIAASAVVLASGGTILYRASVDKASASTVAVTPSGHGLSFAGEGARGTVALSQTKILAGGERQLFVEMKLRADSEGRVEARTPLSIAVVLDTSGSMAGDKIRQAKDAVLRLARDMRDDDEIAIVRYSDDAQLLQPLARVGDVRDAVGASVRAILAAGGTAIPRGLDRGLAALAGAGQGRVKRVVLVSDGLDSTRAESEWLAADSFKKGVVVSSIGIGLDFDESYMGGVAQAGHGNFAFVQNADALGAFLKRELTETATTTIQSAAAHLDLPAGLRFVRAIGADATMVSPYTVQLAVGSIFAGDERRVIVELRAALDAGDERRMTGRVTWIRIGGATAEAKLPGLDLQATTDESAANESVDGSVVASVTSVLSSTRTMEATEAYNKGDTKKATEMLERNIRDLDLAAQKAPAPVATQLHQQAARYRAAAQTLSTAAPSSTAGKLAPKTVMHEELDNVVRAHAY